MSTLTVLMPSRSAGASPQTWHLPPLRFILADRRGKLLQSGTAPLALLPKASATILILAARDVLLVDAVVPPLAGVRLRQALPNIVEDQLLPDGPPSHIALGPAAANAAKQASRRTLAVVDRGWLRYLHESFTAAGHRSIRAVPLVACLPMAQHVDAAADGAAADNATGNGTVKVTAKVAANVTHPTKAALPADSTKTIKPTGATSGKDEDEDATVDDSALADAAEQEELAAMQRLAASATVLVVGKENGAAESLRTLRDAFSEDGTQNGEHTGTLAVPSSADMLGEQESDALPIELAIRRLPVQPVVSKSDRIVAIAPRYSGEGMLIPADALRSTLITVLPPVEPSETEAGPRLKPVDLDVLRGREIYRLVPDPKAEPAVVPLQRQLDALGVSAAPLAFETLAEAARSCPCNLCHFEFTAQPWRLRAATFRQLRLLLGLLIASLLIGVIGINVQWGQLARERNAIQARMTGLLLETFPKTTVVLDPPAQMSRSLGALRISAGELLPDDFLSLLNGMANSLGAIPATSIQTINYENHLLELTFKPAASVDADFAQRLARNGLEGSHDAQRWTIRSSR